MSLRRMFSNAVAYYLLFGTAALLVLSLCGFFIANGYQLRPLAARDYNLTRCDLAAAGERPVLRILDAVYAENLDLMRDWCSREPLARHYGALEMRIVHRDHLDLRELYEARYDLVLAKPELMEGSDRPWSGGAGFELIAKYPEYGSQFVSLHGTPELTADWLRGKKLGLLDDPNSVSAYQIPRAALKRAGLAQVPEIVYFRSYGQLYGALFEGRVDLIPALLSDEGPGSALQLPPGLVLEETLPGPRWYLRRELLETEGYCDLLAALRALSGGARVDYFRSLDVVRPCHAD